MTTTVRALLFDVFGTVVDWRGSLVNGLQGLSAKHGVQGDWERLADAWRAEAYEAILPQIEARSLPWLPLDDVHRLALDELLPRHGLVGLTDAEVAWVNRLWHRLDPWPDAVPGLQRLRQGYPVCALSNGNVSLLLDMARHAGLPWDMLFGADLFRRYKPAAEVYLGACALLDLQPEQVMLCAAHNGDLQAAKELGLATAFIQRPREKGSASGEVSAGGWDIDASDLQDLADQLGLPATGMVPDQDSSQR
ncbi:haloacid dehalogenase [Pseudomonas oryzihabitans]|uniref:(S)-2-haloacid dehalogenase n=1 Tax=Pseudomonas oryzihabitans TaxID=47885 RepID=A0A0U4WMJ1_9PSED|nr:haloacid dehalogenase type II [Pseudomonas oryzihabitans]ALZ85660.1 haloacid dehalogenase [Pseudomonas oryzihabitans]